MQNCDGTTAEQALRNQAIRDRITSHSEVVAQFTTCVLEDGSLVRLDKHSALERVRTCMNMLKKSPSIANKENEKDLQVCIDST